MTKIMIVDDDIETTNIFGTSLKMAGYEPTSVNDSTTAIEMANACIQTFFTRFDDARDRWFQILQDASGNPMFMGTPIIIGTAPDNIDSKIVRLWRRANDYTTKPYLPNELSQK